VKHASRSPLLVNDVKSGCCPLFTSFTRKQSEAPILPGDRLDISCWLLTYFAPVFADSDTVYHLAAGAER
jgi:hypothetical protein